MARVNNSTARGYGWHHQQVRRLIAPVVAAGNATCTRCGKPILPGTAWDLDHNDDRTGYHGPAHPTCNRAEGGRKANQRHHAERW